MITIYVGSTDNHHKFHVGMTQRTVEQRWNDPDYRGKLPYKPTLLFSYEGNIRDEPIHVLILKDTNIGLVRDFDDIASDEIFVVSPSVNDPKNYIVAKVKEAINQIVYGISRENGYPMREEQRAAHDKAVAHFNQPTKLGEILKFLLNAKMRFGKTFTTYQIAKTLGAKRILVLTYKPAVDDSWREDLEHHVDFDGWSYFSTKSDDFSSSNPITLSGEGVEVLFSSFQDFNDFDKAKWRYAVDYDYDLLVIDEMHYGSDTERAKAAIDRLNFNRVLYVSGTPLRELAAGEFMDEEIFTWGYADEQAKRNEERESGWLTENYRWLPEMQFHTYEVCEEAKKVIEAYSDDEGFTMTKMFGSENGETFIEQGVVKLFLDQVFGIGVRPKQSPIKQFAVDHILMVLPPSVKSVNAMCRMLEQRVGNDYQIINVAGDNITSLDKVKTLIGFHPKTITVTCGRFNTGVTVPEWDMVMMLDDGKSAEAYFQTAFRVQSPDQGRRKETCYVVDYNIERLVQVVYEYAAIVARKNETTEQSLRSFLEFAPVLDHSDNEPVRIEMDDALSILTDVGGIEAQFGSAYLFRWGSADLAKKILSTVVHDASDKIQKKIADNEVVKGKNYKEDVSEKDYWSKLFDDYEPFYDLDEKQLRQRAVTMMKGIPTYLWVDPQNSTSDIIDRGEDVSFHLYTQVNIEGFRKLVESGFINVERLDRSIHSLMEVNE